MTAGLVSLVFFAVLGLVLGIWLGMPGQERQSAEDIERAMDAGGGRRRRTKRMFTPMAWLKRKVDVKPSGGSSGRRGFKLESPEDRD